MTSKPPTDASLIPPAGDQPADWAIDRVQRMCASAYVDASVYRQKLLKGFGYPNETFRAAQDALALQEILDRLAKAEKLSPGDQPAVIRPVEETRMHDDEGLRVLGSRQSETLNATPHGGTDTDAQDSREKKR